MQSLSAILSKCFLFWKPKSETNIWKPETKPQGSQQKPIARVGIWNQFAGFKSQKWETVPGKRLNVYSGI